MYLVADFYKKYAKCFGLKLIAGESGIQRKIKLSEAHQPGLGLAGYLKGHVYKRLLVFGKTEIDYLKNLSPAICLKRLESLISKETPALIVAKGVQPPHELINLCDKRQLPLFTSRMTTSNLIQEIGTVLEEELAKSETVQGTLVEVFGLGILIKGHSSVGKSETALGLVQRGHRLITDDIVQVKKRGHLLEGFGADLTKYHMEIRGIGIISVAHLFGAMSVRDKKNIDIVVELKPLSKKHFINRGESTEKYCEILNVRVPCYALSVNPGRDKVLLLETIALNHRLKSMGCDSAKEFDIKLTEMIDKKNRGKR